MPNRVKISTKTTRNKEFNSYKSVEGTVLDPYVILNTVTSATATKANPNIRLLDVNEKIRQTGKAIADDSANNTTIIEVSLQVDHKTALRLYDYSLGNIPDPITNPKGYNEYLYYKELLEENNLSYNNIKSWIATYDNDTWLNENAGIKFNSTATYQIFGAPEQQVLNNRQHYNNCGIESTLNNLAMAGIIKMNENLKDQEKVEKSFLKAVWERNLAGDYNEIGVLNEADGGTLPDDYRDIMEYYGISSKSYYITTKSDGLVYPKDQIKELAYKISQGYGAVLGVSSDILWKDAQSESGGKEYKIDHAIAIIGVVYEDGVVPSEDADPVGFFIHDTGAWMTKFISYDEFIEATLCNYLYGENDPEHGTLSSLKEYDSRLDSYIIKDQAGIFVTLTDEPIKVDTFNLNVTGDKYANILWGNNSNNVIKGMNGNDTLYGRGGRDEIYGGKGNDIIVGNEALDINAKYMVGAVQETFEFNTVDDFEKYLDLAGVDIGTRLDNLDYKEIKPIDPFDNLIEMYKYLQAAVPNGINTIDGGAGSDIIIGGEQADLIYGGKGNDYIYGGDGRNAIYGGVGNDVIVGGYDNDRLFGDAGNDTIFGLDDDDVINGGAGNDHLWGGRGSDMIETGKGNDIVYFEGKEFGQDLVTSKAGSTILKFVAEGDPADEEDYTAASKVTDLFFTLESYDDNEKIKNLNVQYRQGDIEDDESGIVLNNYFTVKSDKTKSLYVADTDDIYTVSVSKKAKATVANTKETGTSKIYGEKIKNSYINNILMTTYEGATITTSKKNDIVTMVNNENPSVLDMVADKITYTGGKDKYVSEDRNTYYTVGKLLSDTNLSIYDNVIGVTKIIIDQAGEVVETDANYASKDDRLYLGSEKSAVKYLFDVGLSGDDAITTAKTGLYLLESNANYANIVKGTADGGFIYMDSFFDYDTEHNAGYVIENPADTAFYGNGRIEGIYYNGSANPDDYTTSDLTTIAENVADWLYAYNQAHVGFEFDTAFEAFANVTGTDLEDLVLAYATPQQGA